VIVIVEVSQQAHLLFLHPHSFLVFESIVEQAKVAEEEAQS
jgi:hypothetical protein